MTIDRYLRAGPRTALFDANVPTLPALDVWTVFLVVLLASRGMAGNDHVDGTRAKDAQEMP